MAPHNIKSYLFDFLTFKSFTIIFGKCPKRFNWPIFAFFAFFILGEKLCAILFLRS